MSVSIAEFWRLLEESRLLTSEQIGRLRSDYGQVKGASQQGNSKTLIEWLIAHNAISRYQATVLSNGRSGPFYYGDYRVYDRIGEGRLSGFFRAVHGPTNHLVLLQFLTGPVTRDADRWQAAAKFALKQATIVDPQVHRHYEPVDLVQFKLVAEEDLHGQSLDERLTTGPLPPHEAARVIRLAVLGLAHLHQQGHVHGDIRPANIWLDGQGNVKLMRDPVRPPEAINFALPDAAETLQLRGDYLAPELAAPQRAPSPQSDIYALGCTLYQSLAGQPPFAGGDVSRKLQRHASEPVQPLETFGVPQSLAQVVMYMMAKNPQVRFQQAAAVADQLAVFVDRTKLNVESPAPPASLVAYEQWIRQKQSALAAAAKANPDATTQPAPKIAIADAPKSTGPAIAINPEKTSTAAPVGATSTAPKRARKEMTPQKLAAILGGAAAALVIGLLLLNSFSGGGDTVDNVANNDLDNPGTTSTDIHTTSSVGTTTNGTTDVSNGNTTSNVDTVATTTTGNAANTGVRQIVVEDDSLLWASPTAGPPVELRCVPPGGQMFVIARPATMTANPEGERVLRAMGPLFDSARDDWEKSAGVKFTEVERLTLALYENGDNNLPRVASVVQLRDPIARAELRQRWGNPASKMVGSVEYFVAGNRAYYAPTDGGDKLFVMGSPDDIEKTAAVNGAPPALRRDIEKLREVSDADRDITILFAPNFLFSGGRMMFSGEHEKLREPLEWFLGEGLTAGMISMEFDESTSYIEVRFASTIDKDKFTLASDFRDRLAEVPAKIEDFIVALNPHPYWRSVAFRFPGMIRYLHQHTRVGTEGDHAVINAALPGPAAHNLVFGGGMLVESPPGQMVASAGPTQPAKKVPQTVEEVLATKTTMSFDATQLEFAVRDLAVDINDSYSGMPFQFKIQIIGKHLERDGITRNQQVRDFNERDKTVAEILTAIVMKANSPAAPEPSHPNQKLIWVVGPNPDNPSENIVLLTTRTAAAENKYTVPAVFQLKPPPM